MLITSLEPEELHVLTDALEKLCAPSASPQHRERMRKLLLVVARRGVTTVDDLVEGVLDVLEDDDAA